MTVTKTANGLRSAGIAAALLAGFVASTSAFAQSATNDSDLFPTGERYLELGTADRNLTIAPFIQLDAGQISFDPGEDFTRGTVALARFYLFGSFDDFGGTFAYDAQNEDFPIRYAFLNYLANDTLLFQVGQQDAPFSLQDYSGGRFLPFISAGQSAALIPGDNLGAMVNYLGENYSIYGGFFGGDMNNGVDDKGYAFAGRASWAPIYEQSQITRGGDATRSGVGTQRVENLLHLGIGGEARFDITQDFSFSGNSNSALLDDAVSTGPTFGRVDDLLRFNLEVSRQISSLSIQGEFTGAFIDGMVDGNGREGFAHGAYLYTTYFLTGERRGYDRSKGVFGRVVPIDPVDQGGTGAIEIGARVDYLDLTDLGDDAGSQIGVSLVANNYLTKRFTVTADYSYTRGLAGAIDGTNIHAINGRFQFAY